jgi:hypothetical protein
VSWLQKQGVARRIGAVVLATGALVGVMATQAQATTTYKGQEHSTFKQAKSDRDGLQRRCRGAIRTSPFITEREVTKHDYRYTGGVDCIY